MGGFSILMFIFGVCVLLVGLYMFTGHKLDKLFWRAHFQNQPLEQWIKIGKWTMISSSVIFAAAILGVIFNF